MSGVGFQFDAEGIGPASAALRNLGSMQAREMLLEAAGAILESSTRARLGETKEAPDGEPWLPWSPKTVKRYRAERRSGNSLLQLDGGLLDSIGWEISPRADYLEIGSNLPYAAIHQFGIEDDGPGIPARPYLGASAEDLDAIEAAALLRLTRLIEGRP